MRAAGHRGARVGRRLGAAFLCLALLLLSPAGVAADGAALGNKPLRVGFPLQDRLTELDENGNYAGYTYEYLEEIAQYTGWDYEFVTIPGTQDESLTAMLDMLEKGQVDLLGSMAYSDALAQVYDYPGHSYGTAHTVLAVLAESTALNEANFTDCGRLRVAVIGSATTRQSELRSFCEAGGIETVPVPCTSDEETLEALRSGRADALLTRDVSLLEGLRVVAKFAPQPFFFATTKGNTELVAQLNAAILKINETDPQFAAELYEKYFGGQTDILLFSQEEQEYLRQAGTLKVAVDKGRAPVQDGEGRVRTGISVDILEMIAQKTGLRFEIVPAASQEEQMAMLQRGEAQLATGILYDYKLARENNLVLSRPYLTTQVLMAVNNRAQAQELGQKRLALPKGVPLMGEYGGPLLRCDTMEHCLQAVQRGAADYTYGNSYTMQYYASQPGYQGLVLIPQQGEMKKICVGIGKPADVDLLTVLNKTIRGLPRDQLQGVLLRNIASGEKLTLAGLIDSNPRAVILAMLCLVLLVCVPVVWHMRSKMLAARRAALDNQRYRQLSELTNEFTFEYDYAADRMTVSENCMNFFGCPRVTEGYSATIAGEGLKLANRLADKGGEGDLQCPLPGGGKRWFNVVCRIVRNKDGTPAFAIGKLVDIQDQMQEKAHLLQKAQRDGLTGLYNAAASRELITACLMGAPAGQDAFLLIDVDRFKEINDRYGHFKGDLVLTHLARTLRATFRQEDIVGRLGGDEFLVYMKNTPGPAAVEEKCAALQREVARLQGQEGCPAVTLSMGVALRGAGQDFDTLYKAADRALYDVKEGGRNAFRLAPDPRADISPHA